MPIHRFHLDIHIVGIEYAVVEAKLHKIGPSRTEKNGLERHAIKSDSCLLTNFAAWRRDQLMVASDSSAGEDMEGRGKLVARLQGLGVDRFDLVPGS